MESVIHGSQAGQLPGAAAHARVLGLCLGASTLSVVDVSVSGGRPQANLIFSEPHEGNPTKRLRDLLKSLDLSVYSGACVTGRKFRHSLALPSISEPEAVELAIDFAGLAGQFDLVLSVGGESFIAYVLGKDGRVSTVHTGNKCASGTGEFFLQQLRRMDLTIEQAMATARSEAPHTISGRCSVFCKSDCTHALNTGADRGSIVAGLCHMLATKMLELVEKSRKHRVLAIGGVTRNGVAMEYVRSRVDAFQVPEHATCFEALGAALSALKQSVPMKLDAATMFAEEHSRFEFLPRLKYFEDKVTFKTRPAATYDPADNECIVGLDVGSTTTKAVVLRISDDAVLASTYLRTNGDPVGASRNCYRELLANMPGPVHIIGLGVTGSGRQIAGLHALTQSITNEIVAHARAAVFFDADVDTIFEIGGQDAKYTYLTGGVASDYAMNEACSAGTGSFLEEAAKECLGFSVTEIADIALRSHRAPDFSDQCSAFISSDIKNAIQDGIPKEDMVAGLVYSVCMNYVNRVKGPRPVGRKIFMQGGVCYNRAVPIAMAALTGKDIIVPPDPGLMGAFGVALDVKDKLKLGLAKEQEFDLTDLAAREVTYLKPFVCAGGKEKCDRKCQVNMIRICGKNYPFGGACNKYYNQRFAVECDAARFDHIEERQRLFMESGNALAGGRTIGMNRSFLTYTYFPLFNTFFSELGFRVVLPTHADPEGIKRKNAAFCLPYELSHGMFHDLLKQPVDVIFLPHILELPVPGVDHAKHTCVFVQSEPYVLKTSFKDELAGRKVLAPRLNFAGGVHSARGDFLKIAEELGVSAVRALSAFERAVRKQVEAEAGIRDRVAGVISELERTGEFGVVIFGRPYNSCAPEANMAIPGKFASRGIHTIPCAALPWEDEPAEPGIYWATGQMLLRAAHYVKRHPQLFAAFITNFSCGPDSFIITFFRDIMGNKPSLTLELDSQTADAGTSTRVEAFLDVVKSYRELIAKGLVTDLPEMPAAPDVQLKGRRTKIHVNGRSYGMKDIHIVYPSMGHFTAEAVAAATNGAGFQAIALPPPDVEDLKTGKANTSCKECLPLTLTTGAFLNYLSRRKDAKEFTAFFMPKQIDPCRLCVYHNFLDRVIRRNRLENAAVISLSDENGYRGLGMRFVMHLARAFMIGDLVEDACNALLALAEDPGAAEDILVTEWRKVLEAMQAGKDPVPRVREMAACIGAIPLKRSLRDAPRVLLTGEIYVRKDDLSRQRLAARLAAKGIVVRVTPAFEACLYMAHITSKGIEKRPLGRRIEATAEYMFFEHTERALRAAMSASGLTDMEMIDVGKTLAHAEHLVGCHIKGETSLTIGAGLREIVSHVSGVISIGPFGCMPSRVAESVLTEVMTMEGKSEASGKSFGVDADELPFLAIESDARAFPQVIDARLDAFCLQVERLHAKIAAQGGRH